MIVSEISVEMVSMEMASMEMASMEMASMEMASVPNETQLYLVPWITDSTIFFPAPKRRQLQVYPPPS